jgi:tetratricopeptide (TPR) repeat protein
MKPLSFFVLLLVMIFTLPVLAQDEDINVCAGISDDVPELAFDASYYEEQVASYDEAIEADSSDAELFAFRGDAHYALQDYESAMADFEAAIELNPEYVYAIARLGDVYQQIFALEDALDAYNQAIELDPSFAYSFIKRGVMYRKLGELKTGAEANIVFRLALNDFKKAIELDPSSVLAYVRRSELYNSMGRVGLAFADARTAVNLEPESVFAHTNLAVSYYVLGNNEAALGAIEDALEFPSDKGSDYAYAFTTRAFICRREEAFTEARADVERALSFDETFAYAHLQLALIERSVGDDEAAAESLVNFVTLFPLDGFAFELLEFYEVDPELYEDSLEIFETWSEFSIDSMS